MNSFSTGHSWLAETIESDAELVWASRRNSIRIWLQYCGHEASSGILARKLFKAVVGKARISKQFATIHDWNSRVCDFYGFPQNNNQRNAYFNSLRIHFIHAKPKNESLKTRKVLPLLLLHGWPGSVREFYDFIRILTEPSALTEYVFEVVAPSLVGFGWSQVTISTKFSSIEWMV